MKKDFIISAGFLQEEEMLHLGEAIRDDLAAFGEALEPLGVSIKYNYERGTDGDYALMFEIMRFCKTEGDSHNDMSCRIMVPRVKMAYHQEVDMGLVSNVSTTILRFLKETLLTEEDLVKLEQNPESSWFIEYMNREMIPETPAVSLPSHSLL